MTRKHDCFPWPFFDKYEKVSSSICMYTRNVKKEKKVADAPAALTPRGCMPGARFKLFRPPALPVS
jgi:hypothetical protein